MRSLIVPTLIRIMLISTAFVIGFGLEGHAQTGQVTGQLTSTE